MGVLRLLLMATWAAWIWFELMVVLAPTLVDRLRGRGHAGDAASAGVLVVCVSAGFLAAVRLGRSPFGALPVPAAVARAAGRAPVLLGPAPGGGAGPPPHRPVRAVGFPRGRAALHR